jgi:hypothetical protein
MQAHVPDLDHQLVRDRIGDLAARQPLTGSQSNKLSLPVASTTRGSWPDVAAAA